MYNNQPFLEFMEEIMTEYIELQIKLSWLKFCKEYGEIPKVQEIKIVDNSYMALAYFLTEDLYNNKPILYVKEVMFDYPEESIEAILFHEFTHLQDSLNFNKFKNDDYMNIMQSYSEFHGAYIQMKQMLSNKDYSIKDENSTILHNDGELSIISFMEQTFNHFISDFNSMAHYNIETSFFETINLYYLIGYSQALKESNIDYIFRFYEITEPSVMLSCKKIYDTLMEGNISIEKVLDEYKELIISIKKTAMFNLLTNKKFIQ